MGSLDGKIAIVTGTSRGVGDGIAEELLRAGATVIGCARSPMDELPAAARVAGGRERSAQLVCDQGDYHAIDRFVSQVVETYGRIDILVNNAGGTVPSPSVEAVPELVQRIQGTRRSTDDFERSVLFHSFAIQMNLISPLWFAIRVCPEMRRGGGGSIINISSGAGHPAGSPTLVSYGAAKSGLNHLTRSLAQEWGPAIRVNCLALGPTMTDNFQSFVLPADDKDGSTYFRKVPLKRAGGADEVGRTCVYLCSGQADYINGTTIEIDGGMLPGVLYEAGLKTITDLM
ncbi:SDR family NAD(P)-dependent oxidoreductase [Mycolicibacterium komossense]|uniref:SDR family oxidoreductase n=1 Tax=Mycolicibacterium komossense TaxID=1779 RepID=A0ABT3C7M0_9MYCO|nr:SDR family oxidoreductase [Mycolicibacterium komossense]MCV7225425.1 SDR family oxidoreductase [Mycolicibacterium komossense]